jgi:hypothetical protein
MVVRKPRKQIRSGPGGEIDERAAGTKARRAFWQNEYNFLE